MPTGPNKPGDFGAQAAAVRQAAKQSLRERDKAERAVTETVTFQTTSIHQGPLPPPDQLGEYAKFIPTAPERFLVMVETEQKHRHRIDFLKLGSVYLGQISALLLGAGGIGGGIYLLLKDKSGPGFGLILTAVGTLGGAYLFDRLRKKPSPASVQTKPDQS